MIDEILDGKYRIDRQLGAGGMGNVYLATHLGTTRVVAVKVIAPKWAADPHFLARFQREAQACGRLRHPNIVNVTDFGIASGRQGPHARTSSWSCSTGRRSPPSSRPNHGPRCPWSRTFWTRWAWRSKKRTGTESCIAT